MSQQPGRSTADLASAATPLATVGVVAGALVVRVHAHELAGATGRIACWSYVTEGLAVHGQAEMVFTLRRGSGEPVDGFPADPFQMFAAVHARASAGQRVGPGGLTRFGDAKFFDRHVLYAHAQPVPGVALPPRCLALVLIDDDECRAVLEFGSARLLGRMGQAARWYPFPPWNDRRRRGVSFARSFDASVLMKIARVGAGEVYVCASDDRLTISMPRAEQALWRERIAALPDTAPLALLTGVDPGADGCLVWVPGQAQPEAITRPGGGGRICGCFLALVGDQPGCGGKLLEDGMAMELTTEAWQALRRALAEGRELTIAATSGGMPLVLTWRDEDRAGGAAGLASGAAPDTGTIAISQVQLLTAEADVTARTSTAELARFCDAIRACAARVLGDRAGELELLLRLHCAPGGHDVGLAHRGEASPEMLQAVLDAVGALPPLAVRGGDVAFELQLSNRAPRDRQ